LKIFYLKLLTNNCLMAQEFGHLGSSDTHVGDLEEIPGWVCLGCNPVQASSGDKHGIQSLASESHRCDLLNWEWDFTHHLSGRGIDLEDLAASHHGDIEIAFMIDGQAIREVGLQGSVAGQVSHHLLAGDVSGLVVIPELLDVQVIRVDVVESVGLVVEGKSIRESDLGLELNQTFFHGVAVQAADLLLEVEDSAVVFRNHCAEVQASMRVSLSIVETNAIVWEFSENANDGGHGVDTVPGDEQQSLASTNDELVGGSINGNDERDVSLPKKLGGVHLVGGGVHAEDLSSNKISPVQEMSFMIVERSLTDE
jgi:hypothetical protein